MATKLNVKLFLEDDRLETATGLEPSKDGKYRLPFGVLSDRLTKEKVGNVANFRVVIEVED